jgi:hypothetical protein
MPNGEDAAVRAPKLSAEHLSTALDVLARFVIVDPVYGGPRSDVDVLFIQRASEAIAAELERHGFRVRAATRQTAFGKCGIHETVAG